MKQNKLTIIGIIAGIVAVAAIVVAFFLDLSPDKENNRIARDNTINYYYTNADGYTHFMSNSKLLDGKLAGSVDAFLTVDGTIGIARAGTGLYMVTEDEITMVHPAGVDRALLSIDGQKILFSTATAVHLYDRTIDEVTAFTYEGIESIKSIAISPDGNTIAFSGEDAEGDLTAYSASVSDEVRILSNDAYILAISDNAEFWYHIKNSEGDLYYCTDKKEKKIGTDVANILEFNSDLTEVVFDMDSITYYSVGGKKARKLVGDASVFSTIAECTSAQGGSNYVSQIRACDSLIGGLFYEYVSSSDGYSRTVYNIWYVNSNHRATALCKGAYQFSVTDNGRIALCLLDDVLYRLDVSDPNSAEVVCSDVYMYCASSDASDIYCIGYDSGLYYISNFGNAIGLMSNASYCTMTYDNKCLCLVDYEETGVVYYIDGAEEFEKVMEDVYYIEAFPGMTCCYTLPVQDDNGNTVYDLYTSGNGKKFTRTLEDVSLVSKDTV